MKQPLVTEKNLKEQEFNLVGFFEVLIEIDREQKLKEKNHETFNL